MGVFKQRTATVRIYGITDFDQDGKDELAIYTFTFPECYFEFKISQIESDSPNSCYLKIPGISKDTYKIFEEKQFAKYGKNQIVEIFCGYDGDEEMVYRGTVSRVRYHFDFGAQWMEVILDQNMKKYRVQKHSICIQKPTTVYEAVSIVCKTFGYRFECLNQDDFQSINIRPMTFEGNIKQCLDSILNKHMSYYVDIDNVVTFSKNKSISKSYTLLFDNGLIAYPILDTSKLEDGDIYNIRHKIIPSIAVGSVIKIPVGEDGLFTDVDTGKYVEYIVEEFVSSFSPTQDITEMECRRKNG